MGPEGVTEGTNVGVVGCIDGVKLGLNVGLTEGVAEGRRVGDTEMGIFVGLTLAC